MLSTWYLVRHGQSEWNLRQLTQGQTVAPRLTPLGVEQARTAAVLVRADLDQRDIGGVAVVRSSDLVRARETAELLVGRLGGDLVLDPRLREQHLGDLEGRGYAETWAAAAAHDWSDPDLPVAGGESPSQLRERMAAAVAAVDPEAVTVVVSHGDAIRAAVAHLSGVPPERAPWVEVPNGAVARVEGTAVTWLTALAAPAEPG